MQPSVVEWKTRSFVIRPVPRGSKTVLAEGREDRVFAIRAPENAVRVKVTTIPGILPGFLRVSLP